MPSDNFQDLPQTDTPSENGTKSEVPNAPIPVPPTFKKLHGPVFIQGGSIKARAIQAEFWGGGGEVQGKAQSGNTLQRHNWTDRLQGGRALPVTPGFPLVPLPPSVLFPGVPSLERRQLSGSTGPNSSPFVLHTCLHSCPGLKTGSTQSSPVPSPSPAQALLTEEEGGQQPETSIGPPIPVQWVFPVPEPC